MIRLGVLDFDTSHVVEFTKRLNHRDIPEDQWVDGAQVVIGCPGESKIMPERIPGYRKEMEKLGVPLVNTPEEMIGKVDGMLVESQEGGVHWQRARPFLEAGLPCFIDKPFTCGLADARKLIELAAKKKVPLFSASSLRYAPELVEFVARPKYGKIEGAVAYGPAHLHDLNPGFYHYAIHAVEILYTLMGPGCERVSCIHERGVDVASGEWRDGRVATVRGIRDGQSDYGVVVFAAKGVVSLPISGKYIYRDLLKRIVGMFLTNKSPLEIHITAEIIAFIEAAWKSGNNHGISEKVEAL